MQIVTHHGRDIAYRVHDQIGSEALPPIVFVHGSGATHEVWASQIPIAQERPVIALDLAGHGASDPLPSTIAIGMPTLNAYVDDLVAVWRAAEATAVVGVSLGGAVIVQALRSGRIRPDTVVLSGTGAQMSLEQSLYEAVHRHPETLPETLQQPGQLFAAPTPELKTATRRAFQDVGIDTLRRDLLSCHHFDVRDILSTINAQTTVIAGEEDGLVPLRNQQHLAIEMPSAGISIIPETAHLPMIERPQVFRHVLQMAFR